MITLNPKQSALRSKLEKSFAKKNPGILNEPVVMPYGLTYHPDFVGPKNLEKLLKGEPCYVLELKGWLRPEDRTKMIALTKAYPWLKFVMIFDNADSKYSKTMTKRQFCVKHGMLVFSTSENIPEYILE